MDPNFDIIIDPLCRINYASYYIKGIWDFAGKSKTTFRIDPFIYLHSIDRELYYKGLAFVVLFENQTIKKIFIDFNDYSDFNETAFEWCDVYCKVNLNLNTVKPYYHIKTLPIGPGFGVSLWGWFTMFMFLINLIKGKELKINYFKQMFKDYLYTIVRRLPLEKYIPGISDRNYCYHLSTLWYDALTDKTTNRLRGKFIESCKNIYPNFEGGFYFISSDIGEKIFQSYLNYKETYKEFLVKKRVSLRNYLKKTKKSAIVFNTPSVGGCHGWKLAEYLALGKAIISTPFNNKMPGDFIAGKHFHLVENESEIESAIRYLFENDDYRISLEKSALSYFNEYLTPKNVIQRIFLSLKTDQNSI